MQAGNVFAFVPDISSAKGAANAIIQLLDSTPLTDTESTGKKLVPGEMVQARNIHFTYPTRHGFRVLCNLLPLNLELMSP